MAKYEYKAGEHVLVDGKNATYVGTEPGGTHRVNMWGGGQHPDTRGVTDQQLMLPARERRGGLRVGGDGPEGLKAMFRL